MDIADATKPEAPVDVYEKLYAEEDRTYDDPHSSAYYPLFSGALGALETSRARHGVHSVLEVGCGSGTLGRMVMGSGFAYRGFDYARTGVEKALRKNPDAKFFWGDATTDTPYNEPYDAILCCEVLEHITNDLDVVRRWRPGSPIVCSVPNFDYESHVRHFRDESEVRRRYGHLISIDSIRRIPKSQRSGLTMREYLRRVRWAREMGWRNVLGTIGINSFEWSGGWFLFTGIRRSEVDEHPKQDQST